MRNDHHAGACADCFGQPYANLFFLSLVEHTDNAVDGLTGVDRVQGAHDEMARFRGRHADLNRFAIAHFSDEHDLRGLAKCRAQSGSKVDEVVTHFALIEGRSLLGVDEFDRIFQRDDMDRLRFVQVVQ